MTELRPLLQCSEDELELALLGAVRTELPSASGLREAALALGLAAATADALASTLPGAGTALSVHAASLSTPLATSSGAATTCVVSSGASTAAALGSASLGMLGKGLLGGALVSFLALTTLDQTLGSSTPPKRITSSARVTAISAQQSEPSALHTTSAAENDAEPVTVAPLRAVTSRHAPTRVAEQPPPMPTGRSSGRAGANAAFAPIAAPQPATTAPSPVRSASLAAEIQLLDRARAALAAGDTNRAGQALETYAASRPSPVLAQEAALLRVRLLLARGQISAAAELARRIIAQYPGSHHVDSLHRLATEP